MHAHTSLIENGTKEKMDENSLKAMLCAIALTFLCMGTYSAFLPEVTQRRTRLRNIANVTLGPVDILNWAVRGL